MTEESKCCKTTVTVAVILTTILLVAFLVRQMVKYTHPAPVGAERAAARAKDNAQIRQDSSAALQNYGWADQAKGLARLPIDEAMKMTVQGYQKPADFRKDMLTRVDKANVAPPKAPEKPNQYE